MDTSQFASSTVVRVDEITFDLNSNYKSSQIVIDKTLNEEIDLEVTAYYLSGKEFKPNKFLVILIPVCITLGVLIIIITIVLCIKKCCH